jgi:dihydroorotase
MIDPHVHLRDYTQSSKETLRHGLSLAWRAGLDGVFEMPNTDPPLTSREEILRRIDLADRAISELGIPIFHGIFAGLVRDHKQIEEMVRAHGELFPRVVGLKMFAGHSTGHMGIIGTAMQELVYRRLAELDYKGVLAVHCEKEALIHSELWDPARPSSHAEARPPAAEVASIDDQKRLAAAAGFRGTLHVVHISTPWSLDLLRSTHEKGKDPSPFKATCALTPHHALLDSGMMSGPHGILLKTNPPLRMKPMPHQMLMRLLKGEIDWIETDHAPHTLKDKTEGHASGIPVLPFYPVFLGILRELGMGERRIDELTHDAICRTFGAEIANRKRKPDAGLAGEYEFDPFAALPPLTRDSFGRNTDA